MNLQALKASVLANKVPLGVGGAALVAVLAWRTKIIGAKTAAAADATPTGYAVAGVSSSPYASSGYTAPNDSTGSDVYNAIQPQLEALKQLMTPTASPIPVPAVPQHAAGYYRPAGETGIFRYDEAGQLDWLNGPQYAALGSPAYTDVSPDDAMWKSPSLGVNPRNA